MQAFIGLILAMNIPVILEIFAMLITGPFVIAILLLLLRILLLAIVLVVSPLVRKKPRMQAHLDQQEDVDNITLYDRDPFASIYDRDPFASLADTATSNRVGDEMVSRIAY
jgi:hypothetical protein